MKTLLIISTLLVLCSCQGLRKELNGAWKSFKETYNKDYKLKEIEYKRRFIWEQNVDFVQQHNLEYDLGLHTYTVGINEFSDWSPKEYAAYLNGFKGEKKTNSSKIWNSYFDSKALPDSWDWRDKGYVTPVKNQGQCGSCWAFSSTGSLEGQHFRRTGKLVSLSEQDLVDCVSGNAGCNGGWMDTAFDWVIENGGIDVEQCYPYTAKDGTCIYKQSCSGSTCSGHYNINKGDEGQLKSAVATQGPISVAIDANHPSFMQYRSGVFTEPKCSSVQSDHAVLVVGYGTQDGKDYWLVKNSWGTSWGMNGYIMMARNSNNMCAIATYATFPIV